MQRTRLEAVVRAASSLVAAVLLGSVRPGRKTPPPPVHPISRTTVSWWRRPTTRISAWCSTFRASLVSGTARTGTTPSLRNGPFPGDERHQLSYTLAALHAGALPGSGVGIGDVFFNYRYQLVGSGDTRVAFSPRLSLIFPTGDSTLGRGAGSFGVQTSLPLSVVLSKKLVSHWNAGATFFPRAQDASGDRAAYCRLQLWVRALSGWSTLDSMSCWKPCLPGRRLWWPATGRSGQTHSFLSPGVRWAYNFKNGLQIVPGIGVPLGVGPSAGERAVLLYLSFEHPFRKLPEK